jgi:hypothetical protein
MSKLVVKCKTPDCPFWLIIGEGGVKTSSHLITFKVSVVPWQQELRCPECGKAYRYSNQDVPV